MNKFETTKSQPQFATTTNLKKTISKSKKKFTGNLKMFETMKQPKKELTAM